MFQFLFMPGIECVTFVNIIIISYGVMIFDFIFYKWNQEFKSFFPSFFEFKLKKRKKEEGKKKEKFAANVIPMQKHQVVAMYLLYWTPLHVSFSISMRTPNREIWCSPQENKTMAQLVHRKDSSRRQCQSPLYTCNKFIELRIVK